MSDTVEERPPSCRRPLAMKKEALKKEIVRQRIERKLRLYRGEIDERKLASLYRSLIGAGFPSDLIRKELHRITREEIPEVEPNDETA